MGEGLLGCGRDRNLRDRKSRQGRRRTPAALRRAAGRLSDSRGQGQQRRGRPATRPHLAGRGFILIDVVDPKAATAKLAEKLKPNGGRRPGWIVDGLFGIGLDRSLDANWRRFIEAVNATGLPILSLDTPSGLNADTGEPAGRLRSTP